MSDEESGGARLGVNLNEQTNERLKTILAWTPDNKTDIIAKGIHLYYLMINYQALGGGLYLQEGKDMPIEKVRFL